MLTVKMVLYYNCEIAFYEPQTIITLELLTFWTQLIYVRLNQNIYINNRSNFHRIKNIVDHYPYNILTSCTFNYTYLHTIMIIVIGEQMKVLTCRLCNVLMTLKHNLTARSG